MKAEDRMRIENQLDRHWVRLATAIGTRRRELGQLEGREIGRRTVEDDPRQDLVLRQIRFGGQDYARRRGAALDGDGRGHIV